MNVDRMHAAQRSCADYLHKRAYFEAGHQSLERFWARLGGRPDVHGASVLEVGCGVGRLAVDLAMQGAARVVALDINQRSIDFACEHVRQCYPQLMSTVDFRCADARDCRETNFDVIVSKDTFEHLLELEEVVTAMANRLKSGGRIYVGFGPLYRGPFGDHHWTRLHVPWGHLLVPESVIVARLNRHPERLPSWSPRAIRSIGDLGLNRRSLADYLGAFESAGLATVYCRPNAGRHPVVRLSCLLAKVPHFREYLTHNLYCILERPS